MPAGEGHTEFPRLNLSIQPRRNAALLFCNFLPNGKPDNRVVHAGRPVIGNSQRKFGMNIWITDCSLQDLTLIKSNKKNKQKIEKSQKGNANNTILNSMNKSYVDNQISSKFNAKRRKLQVYYDTKNEVSVHDNLMKSSVCTSTANLITASNGDDLSYEVLMSDNDKFTDYWNHEDENTQQK